MHQRRGWRCACVCAFTHAEACLHVAKFKLEMAVLALQWSCHKHDASTDTCPVIAIMLLPKHVQVGFIHRHNDAALKVKRQRGGQRADFLQTKACTPYGRVQMSTPTNTLECMLPSFRPGVQVWGMRAAGKRCNRCEMMRQTSLSCMRICAPKPSAQQQRLHPFSWAKTSLWACKGSFHHGHLCNPPKPLAHHLPPTGRSLPATPS